MLRCNIIKRRRSGISYRASRGDRITFWGALAAGAKRFRVWFHRQNRRSSATPPRILATANILDADRWRAPKLPRATVRPRIFMRSDFMRPDLETNLATNMVKLRRRCLRWVAVLVFATALLPAMASEQFPFGSELMLDQAPMRGSKRIPILEIEENGAASIDLWCASALAQATIGDNSITIIPGDLQAAQCEPERQTSDANLLAALAQVTNWRREGDLIEFSGATTLRFRLMTN